MAAALSVPIIGKVGRGIVHVALAINLVLLLVVIDTALDAKSATLGAQQDLGVAFIIVLYGGTAAAACLLTLIVGAFIGIRAKLPLSTLCSGRIFWLGVINLLSPVILLLGLSWFVREYW
ncbi:MAG TPA: hypothetical protein VFC18_04730 [Burkholderiales bacterium]|nr:hypothetical protein [Burkholderiales bacterium]